MSYILDSIKKSDKERRTVDHPSAMVMRSPAFLDNDKPRGHFRLIIITLGLVFLAIVAYFAFAFWQNKQNIDFSLAPDIVSESTDKQPPESPSTISSAGERANKEEAIALYKQVLSEKSRPEIDSLYAELKEKKQEALSQGSQSVPENSSTRDVFDSEPEAGERLAQSTAVAQEEPAAIVEDVQANEPSSAPLIPSIYELDAYFRTTIPSINYGAHIYATDNNSGFVILDGARRREGDKLDSGLFVEKIQEEHVVLSYNGTVFSLPAMKSWQGK